jgi:6-phosphofructokinase 2
MLILTVTLNPAIDLSTTVDHVAPTLKMRCGPVRRDPGGGGVNVARVCRRLGAEATALFPAGGATGALLHDLLLQEGVRCQTVSAANPTREDFTVVETATGREFRFVVPGEPLADPEWRECLEALRAAPVKPDFIVASGSLPPGAPDDAYARVGDIARADGIPWALDTSGSALRLGLLGRPDLIKPNLRELREITGHALGREADLVPCCRDIVRRGGAAMVLLSLGSSGALLVTGDGVWRAPAANLQPVSTVGAGDSLMAGMVFALAERRPPEDALRFAMAVAAATTLAHGTGLAQPSDVQRLQRLIDVTPIVTATE